MDALLLGAISSLIAWVLVSQILRPKVETSPNIAEERVSDDQRVKYVVKIRNGSRLRDVLSVEVGATLVIPRSSGGIALWDVPVSNQTIRRLSRRATIRDNDIDSRRRYYRGYRKLNLHLHEMSRHGQDGLAAMGLPLDGNRQDYEAGYLRRVLASTPGAHVRIEALGFDSISGSLRYFESSRIAVEMIKSGLFAPRDSFEVRPYDQ